jgi:hypothetical protein
LLYFCIHLRHRHREHNQRLERLRLVFQHCLHIRTGRQLPHILFSAATATYYCGHGHIHIECTHTAIPQSGGWGCGKGRYARDNEDPRRISFVHWRSTRGAVHQPEQRLPGVVQRPRRCGPPPTPPLAQWRCYGARAPDSLSCCSSCLNSAN